MIYIDYHHLELIFPNLESLQKFRIREEFWGKHDPGGLPNEWREIPATGCIDPYILLSDYRDIEIFQSSENDLGK